MWLNLIAALLWGTYAARRLMSGDMSQWEAWVAIVLPLLYVAISVVVYRRVKDKKRHVSSSGEKPDESAP